MMVQSLLLWIVKIKTFKVDIKEAQQRVDQWIKQYGVKYFSELTNTVILAEEVGELSKIMVRKYGEQSFKTKEKEATASQDIEEEMADILFVLICLANQMDIDLNKAFLKTIDKKTNRDKNRHKNNKKLQ